ncbi:tannase/feruloyl esterase family alpha/beta hydrolase [Variovorax sp. ZT4R33]|uniref:tannase/feruloyl esterase family alpha/beta hydrolase n=1 Tax=Variovorax sp. ZT4R33 TaxID=3443743 RepID=UPI003F454EB9
MRTVLLAAAAVLTGCGSPPPPAMQAQPQGQRLACESLGSVRTEASIITSAQVVSDATAIGGAKVDAKFCRVQGVARPSSDSEIKFEVWLPEDWSGRFKLNGTGGYAGAVPFARLAQDVEDGFVTAGSNMGHDGGESAAWTLNHPEKVKDWGLRSHYYVATAAKALANAFYARPVRYSYFEGCSNGGRQAMMMAQNYPALFDGIVAGAPSMFYPDLLYWLLWTGKQQIPVAGKASVLTDAKRLQITQRVLAVCDANDGLVDGQITNPRACKFNVDTIGPAGDKTLTAEELAVVKAMYAGTTTEAGVHRSPGAKLGSEADWIPLFADNGGYGAFIEHFVYSRNTPNFDWRRELDFTKSYDEAKAALTPVTAAPSPDISAFVARGGKLLHYHGWNDSVVPPDGSIAYLYALTQFERLRNLPKADFDREIDKLTPQQVAATGESLLPKVREYHRLFMLPAMGHCNLGGTGPKAIGGGSNEPPREFRTADHHVVNAVMKWTEQGVAPERIIATQLGTDGKVVRQRPVCAFPAEARYKGTGDINAAENFHCVTPSASDRPLDAGDMLLIQSSLRQRDLTLPNR